MNPIVTPEVQEDLAGALEEAAERVRQFKPETFEYEVQDDVDTIRVGPTETIQGMRSPLLRRFDIRW